jgi:hypothetical protein
MKLRLRVTAICLAAVLTLGVLQPVPAHADNELTDPETETEQVQVEQSNGELVLTDLNQEDESAAPTEAVQEPGTDPAESADAEADQGNDPAESADAEADQENDQAEPVNAEATQETTLVEASNSDAVQDPVESEEEADSAELVDPEGAPMAASEELEDDQAEPADQDMMLMAASEEAVETSLTITNVELETPAGVNDKFVYQIYLWSTSASGAISEITGTYGNTDFTSLTLTYTQAYAKDLPYSGYYNYYGYGTVTLGAGETVTIPDLPEGCSYHILAAASANYYVKNVTSTYGTVDDILGAVTVNGASGPNQVTCYNDYAPHSFRLSEEVVSSDPDSVNDEFTFTIYLYSYGYGNSDNKPLFDADSVDVEIATDAQDGVEAPNLGSDHLTFHKETKQSGELPGISKAGTYNVAQVTLKHGQNIVLKNLGSDYGCYVIQTRNIHYKLYLLKSRQVYQYGADSYEGGYQDQYTYIDSCNVSSSAAFINAQVSLTITKQVKNSDTTRDFTFYVFFLEINPDTGYPEVMNGGDFQLTYSTGETETVKIQQPSDSVAAYSDYTMKGTVAEIHLKAGQSATIEALPMGIYCNIVEVPVENYTVSATADFGTVSSEGHVFADSFLATDASATFTNTFTPAPGIDLTLSKTITGLGNPDQDFPFQITLTDGEGNPLSNRDIMVLLSDGTETIYTTDADGVLTINLKHGQTVTLEDLPKGTQYSVLENDADNYTTTFQVADGQPTESKLLQGTLDDAESVAIQVTNQGIVTPTGVETENRPFVLLFTGSAAAFLLLLVERRRRRKRR